MGAQTVSSPYDPARRGVLMALLAGAAAGISAAPTAAQDASGSMLTPGLVTPTIVSPEIGEPDVTVFPARVIHTMDPTTEAATAVAVAGRRIIAVGSRREIEHALGDRPFAVDERFAGKVLMPGLIEQHLHPILGALTLSQEVIAIEDWVLPGRTAKAARSPAEYMDRLRAAEKALEPGAFLFTWGYHQLWHGPLHRDALDAVSRSRPIAVWHRSAHEFYLNGAALAALGLSEAALAGHGQASTQADWAKGHFYEKGLELILGPLITVMATPERFVGGLKMLVRYLHGNGVTALQEPGALMTPQVLAVYRQILGADTTPFYSFFLADGRSLFDKYREAGALAATERTIAQADSGKVRFLPKQVKLFADGAIISQLMQMKDGYTDGHHGEWIAPPADIQAATKLYWDAGYQIHTHVNGDLGLEVLLDALERCMRENPRADHRSVIVHFANSTEEQVGRIARLGAIVSANPYYVTGFADRYAEIGLGPERADNMVRLGSVVRHGVPFSLHSDLPMAPSNPLFLAWCAVNRTTASGRTAGPDQRVTVEQALRAITIDAARSWRLEDQLGSVTTGKIANFTALEEDPRAVAPSALKDIPVAGTVFEGRPFPLS